MYAIWGGPDKLLILKSLLMKVILKLGGFSLHKKYPEPVELASKIVNCLVYIYVQVNSYSISRLDGIYLPGKSKV